MGDRPQQSVSHDTFSAYGCRRITTALALAAGRTPKANYWPCKNGMLYANDRLFKERFGGTKALERPAGERSLGG
jgi:hypothetical protein